MGELILTIPNGAAGKIALERLSGGNDLGVEYRLPMTDVFNKLDLRADRLLQLQQSYHLVSVRDGDEIPVISRILRRFDDPENMQGPGKVTYAEYNWQGSLSSPLLAFDPVNHATYVANLNVAAAYKAGVWGRGVRVAVIDSGVDAAFVHRSYDVFSATNAWSSGGIDMLGHGSAMAMIIHDIAPDAEIVSVRITDSHSIRCWDALAGILAAGLDPSIDIVNLSIGFADFGVSPCPICGTSAHSRSLSLENALRSIVGMDEKRPIFIAAAGNEGRTSGFDYPAAYLSDGVVAVGSVNGLKSRSTFSNIGTRNHPCYVMAPGGDGQPKPITVSEAVGTLHSIAGTEPIAGTSASAAYASGVFALYMSDVRCASSDRTQLLAHVKSDCEAPSAGSSAADYGAGLLRYNSGGVAGTESDDSHEDEPSAARRVVEKDGVLYIDRLAVPIRRSSPD